MSTSIEWTQRPGTKGETWNPTTGCNKPSQGCKHCFAEVMHRRLRAMGVKGYEQEFLKGAVPQPHKLSIPLKWKKPRTVFVNSMSDLFHEAVPFDFIDQVFAVMALTPQHTYQILTKRPERMAEYLDERWMSNGGFNRREVISARMCDVEEKPANIQRLKLRGAWPLPNVWLGTSVEDQAAADAHISHLLKCPAAVRFLSCEPLLGAVDLREHMRKAHTTLLPNGSVRFDPYITIHWVIAGGESGPKARPMHPDWARSLRDQCKAAGVPFFFKQWGEWGPVTDIDAAVNYPSTRCMLFSSITGKSYMGVKTLSGDGQHMARMGKHASGRRLDGVEYQEWPEVNEPQPVQA